MRNNTDRGRQRNGDLQSAGDELRARASYWRAGANGHNQTWEGRGTALITQHLPCQINTTREELSNSKFISAAPFLISEPPTPEGEPQEGKEQADSKDCEACPRINLKQWQDGVAHRFRAKFIVN